MKIFMSYSTPDLNLVAQIAERVRSHGQVFYWDKDKPLGNEPWPTISGWIDQSDVVLVLITGNTVARAMAVGNEVGRARAKGKKIIPLVAHDVPANSLGCLQGIIFERIDPYNPEPTLRKLEEPLTTRKKEVETSNFIAVVAGGLGLIWLMSNSK